MKKLYKSNNKVLAGVCAGLADYIGIDVTIVRLVTLILIVAGGLSLWCYIIAAIIIPEAPAGYTPEVEVDEEDNIEE